MGVRRGAVMSNRILLVDDDREFRSEFKEYLSEYDVMEAENGADALKILKKANDIDLVILDVKMPGISGTEVLREIRKIDPGLGVIILTAYSSENVAVEALKGHADDYMEKPLDIARVRETIEKILEANEGMTFADAETEYDLERAEEAVKEDWFDKLPEKPTPPEQQKIF